MNAVLEHKEQPRLRVALEEQPVLEHTSLPAATSLLFWLLLLLPLLLLLLL